MTQQQYDAAITRLERLSQRIEAWRDVRTKRSPMPADLWDAATDLAGVLGVSAVKSALRLNYESLRQRLTKGARSNGEEPGFVQLNVTQAIGPAMGAVIEMSDASGVRLKVQLPAGSGLDLPRLVEAFRRRS